MQNSMSSWKRYGFALSCVVLAALPALVLQHFNFHDVELPLLLFAVALTSWHAGTGPAVLAIVLSSICFDYFFAPPLYQFTLTPADIPAVLVLVCFAALITRFAAVRRHIEGELLRARDHLQAEVAERTQQASLLNLTHDTIFVRDMNDVITYWNRGAEELYGFTASEAIGERSRDLLRTTLPQPMETIRAQLVRTGRWEGEVKYLKADGKEVLVSSRWSLRRDDAQQPAAVLETHNDISERKRREEEIRGLNQELAKRSAALEASNKELEAFAYSVSHDLRAPLRHMSGFAELLRSSAGPVLNEKSTRYLAVVLEEANRMGSLIDDLLAFSRIGRAEAHYSWISLQEIVQEAVGETTQDANCRKV